MSLSEVLLIAVRGGKTEQAPANAGTSCGDVKSAIFMTTPEKAKALERKKRFQIRKVAKINQKLIKKWKNQND